MAGRTVLHDAADHAAELACFTEFGIDATTIEGALYLAGSAESAALLAYCRELLAQVATGLK